MLRYLMPSPRCIETLFQKKAGYQSVWYREL
jgi:hypothetical protein